MRTSRPARKGLGMASLGFALASTFVVSTAQAAPQAPGVGELGGPTRVLTPTEMDQWLRGRDVFDIDFHKSRGLGTPLYNADSCRACHQDPVLGGAGGLELNVSRMGNDNGGAGPFQDVPGGQALSKLSVPWLPGREEYTPGVPDVFEQRQTPALFGAGLIDSIPDAEILSREDPNDLNGDGVRGIARHVPIASGGTEVGHFGWKAQIPTSTDFVRDAMAGECGITTPVDGRGFGLANDGDPVLDPELTVAETDDIAFFLSLLGPPPRGGSQDPDVALGEQLFDLVGCAKCHVPVLAGAGGPVALYSDLLLHDVMGPTFRGMAESGAASGVFRTTPLWGVKHSAPYMHDGRAEDLPQAIRAHHGEANRVVNAFERLPRPQKQALLLFLLDL